MCQVKWFVCKYTVFIVSFDSRSQMCVANQKKSFLCLEDFFEKHRLILGVLVKLINWLEFEVDCLRDLAWISRSHNGELHTSCYYS